MFSGRLPDFQEEIVLVTIAERLSLDRINQVVGSFQRSIRDGIASMVDHSLEMAADHLAKSIQPGDSREYSRA